MAQIIIFFPFYSFFPNHYLDIETRDLYFLQKILLMYCLQIHYKKEVRILEIQNCTFKAQFCISKIFTSFKSRDKIHAHNFNFKKLFFFSFKKTFKKCTQQINSRVYLTSSKKYSYNYNNIRD